MHHAGACSAACRQRQGVEQLFWEQGPAEGGQHSRLLLLQSGGEESRGTCQQAMHGKFLHILAVADTPVNWSQTGRWRCCTEQRLTDKPSGASTAAVPAQQPLSCLVWHRPPHCHCLLAAALQRAPYPTGLRGRHCPSCRRDKGHCPLKWWLTVFSTCCTRVLSSTNGSALPVTSCLCRSLACITQTCRTPLCLHAGSAVVSAGTLNSSTAAAAALRRALHLHEGYCQGQQPLSHQLLPAAVNIRSGGTSKLLIEFMSPFLSIPC